MQMTKGGICCRKAFDALGFISNWKFSMNLPPASMHLRCMSDRCEVCFMQTSSLPLRHPLGTRQPSCRSAQWITRRSPRGTASRGGKQQRSSCCFFVLKLLCRFNDFIAVLHHILGFSIEKLSGFCQTDTMVGACQKMKTQLLFENIHLAHDGRGRNVKCCRSFVKALQISSKNKRFQIFAVHRLPPFHNRDQVIPPY